MTHGYRDPDLTGRLRAFENGTLPENVRERYPTALEHQQ